MIHFIKRIDMIPVCYVAGAVVGATVGKALSEVLSDK